jgi:hypothetical protein
MTHHDTKIIIVVYMQVSIHLRSIHHFYFSDEEFYNFTQHFQ